MLHELFPAWPRNLLFISRVPTPCKWTARTRRCSQMYNPRPRPFGVNLGLRQAAAFKPPPRDCWRRRYHHHPTPRTPPSATFDDDFDLMRRSLVALRRHGLRRRAGGRGARPPPQARASSADFTDTTVGDSTFDQITTSRVNDRTNHAAAAATSSRGPGILADYLAAVRH